MSNIKFIVLSIKNWIAGANWRALSNGRIYCTSVSLSSLLWRPTQLYLRGEEEEPKNEGLLFQSTIDIHILSIPVHSWHTLSKRATAAFISAALLSAATKLRRLALCAFILSCFWKIPMLVTDQSGESGDCSRLRVWRGGKRDWQKQSWQRSHSDCFSRRIEVSLVHVVWKSSISARYSGFFVVIALKVRRAILKVLRAATGSQSCLAKTAGWCDRLSLPVPETTCASALRTRCNFPRFQADVPWRKELQ